MIKLNKNGWGIRAMIAFVCIFILCLILSFIGFSKAGFSSPIPFVEEMNSDKTTTTYDYASVEQKVLAAAKTYVSLELDNKISDNHITITVSELENAGYLDPIYSENNKECSGYVDVYNLGSIEYSTYVKCGTYKTTGYDRSKDS